MALTSTIPAVVLSKLIPIVMKQLDQLTNISSMLSNALNSLPTNVKCDDPRIKDIKQKLNDIKKVIDNIKLIKPKLEKISISLNIVATSAGIVKMIQMLIPASPGVPQVPFSMVAKTVDELGKNCNSANNSLSTINNVLNSAIMGIDNVIAQAIIKLSSVCVNERFAVSSRVSKLIDKKLTRNGGGGNVQDTTNNQNGGEGQNSGEGNVDNNLNTIGSNVNNQYKTYFYTEDNVSNSDLQLLTTLVNDLDIAGRIVQENIIEMPANVITSTIAGKTPLPIEGTIGDFYVNTTDRKLWGPKASDDEWDTTPKTY